MYIQVKFCAVIHRTCGQLYCYDTRHKLNAIPSPCPMEICYLKFFFSSSKYWKLRDEKSISVPVINVDYISGLEK